MADFKGVVVAGRRINSPLCHTVTRVVLGSEALGPDLEIRPSGLGSQHREPVRHVRHYRHGFAITPKGVSIQEVSRKGGSSPTQTRTSLSNLCEGQTLPQIPSHVGGNLVVP